MQNYNLKGKVVLVTGAASGLGKAMSLALLSNGASILALDINADKVADELAGSASGRCIAMKFDVRSLEHCDEAVRRAREELGGLHGVVNCAGIGMPHLRADYHTRPVRFWEADPQLWQDVVDINMRGPFLLARAATPHMIEQKWGRIVNVTCLTARRRQALKPRRQVGRKTSAAAASPLMYWSPVAQQIPH